MGYLVSLAVLTASRLAQTGTYDDLAIMRLSAVPRDGSSGGPIVDAAGSVVGIIRGSTQQYGDPVERGFATPAERVFERERGFEMCDWPRLTL